MVDDVPLCFTSIILRSVVSFSDVCVMKKKLIYFNTIGPSTPSISTPEYDHPTLFVFDELVATME